MDGDANLYLNEGNVTLIATVSCTRPQPNLQWRLQGGSVLESTTRSCSKDKCGDKKDDNYAECKYTLDTSVTEAQHEKSLQVIVTGQAIAGSLLANATIRINGEFLGVFPLFADGYVHKFCIVVGIACSSTIAPRLITDGDT